MDNTFGELIYSYTRAQAIADGVLIDVSDLAKEAGFVFPVAVTSGVWAEAVGVSESEKGVQDEKGRLWDILNVLLFMIRASKDEDSDVVNFEVTVWRRESGEKKVSLWSKCHGGDNGEPVITIMLVGED
jgi:hypothetical protein